MSGSLSGSRRSRRAALCASPSGQRRIQMKRLAVWLVAAIALVLVAGATEAFAQGTFKIPFPFQAGTTKLLAGNYSVAQKGEGQITLRQEATGKEFQVPFTKKLP